MTSRRGSTPALVLAYVLGFLAFRQLVLFALGPELSPAVLGLGAAAGSGLAALRFRHTARAPVTGAPVDHYQRSAPAASAGTARWQDSPGVFFRDNPLKTVATTAFVFSAFLFITSVITFFTYDVDWRGPASHAIVAVAALLVLLVDRGRRKS